MIAFASVHAGFSLLEVLITVVIVSIGLLGLAGMQATGLQNNQKAYHRSQATVLAYDLTDRIRANTVSIADYVDPLTPRTAHDSCGGCAHAIATALANCNGQGCATAVAAIQVNCAAAGGCTALKMAQNDLFEWEQALNLRLPNGSGSLPPPIGNLYTVSITWDEKNREDGAATASVDVSFTLE